MRARPRRLRVPRTLLLLLPPERHATPTAGGAATTAGGAATMAGAALTMAGHVITSRGGAGAWRTRLRCCRATARGARPACAASGAFSACLTVSLAEFRAILGIFRAGQVKSWCFGVEVVGFEGAESRRGLRGQR
eukprot:2110565-Rhodomonas_salina.2